ncbi:MAG: 4Fe-4S binding protein [Candidatus Bathyarchaeia archaeon]
MTAREAVLVIGGGIAGIQAALDVADRGFNVYLLDTSPSIGGVMASLDKTFPTNDCSICIEAPKMVEVLRHPNLELLTYCEVKRVEGSVGNFKVTILKKPRYVDEDKCTGCGKCVEVCPVEVPNEFDLGIGKRKAIYIPFPQAVPMINTLDSLCRKGKYRERGACIGTCVIDCSQCRKCPIAKCVQACHEEGRDAVMLWERPKRVKIEVGSIIVATGFEVLKPTMMPNYGYGVYTNVILALQYERLLCASGPTAGRILRPSDNKNPKKLAWIQCVGSMDRRTGIRYCSRICCAYATKEAIITKEHDPDIETYIFYTHLKTYGKGFWEYFERAKELGVKYIRSRPAEIKEDPKTRDLVVVYEDLDTNEPKEMKVDMVMLSSAIVPSNGNKKLAEILGIELDEYGFFKEKDPYSSSLETNVEGIYLCGCCLGPRDIPESISEASAAAAKAVRSIVRAKGESYAG